MRKTATERQRERELAEQLFRRQIEQETGRIQQKRSDGGSDEPPGCVAVAIERFLIERGDPSGFRRAADGKEERPRDERTLKDYKYSLNCWYKPISEGGRGLSWDKTDSDKALAWRNVSRQINPQTGKSWLSNATINRNLVYLRVFGSWCAAKGWVYDSSNIPGNGLSLEKEQKRGNIWTLDATTEAKARAIAESKWLRSAKWCVKSSSGEVYEMDGLEYLECVRVNPRSTGELIVPHQQEALRDLVFLELYLATGARPGELVRLRLGDFPLFSVDDPKDQDLCSLVISESVSKTQTRRTVHVAPCPHLKNYLVHISKQYPGAGPAAPLFAGRKATAAAAAAAGLGVSREQICRRLREILIEAGMPEHARTYDLRHTFISRARAAGISDLSIADQVGQITLTAQRRYGVVQPSEHAKMDGLVNTTPPKDLTPDLRKKRLKKAC